ncbi:hypothetical protein AAVH_35096, partial [Aphelenchoides avenae]
MSDAGSSTSFGAVRRFKVITLGVFGTGKTSLIHRFTHGKFLTEPLATIGSASPSKELMVGDEKVTLEVWDTAGQER